MPDDKKTPLDSAVELFVFAPLGLALTARDSLPDLIAKGRQQLTSQVMMARMMGQYAVAEGEREARKRLGEVTGTLSSLGLLPNGQTATSPAPPTPTPGPATDAVEPEPSAPAPASGATNGRATSPAPPSQGEKAHAAHNAVSGALAIPGYDTLSASQVVQRLAGLAVDELEAVRGYEAATRGRRTILSKIAQLQSGSTG